MTSKKYVPLREEFYNEVADYRDAQWAWIESKLAGFQRELVKLLKDSKIGKNDAVTVLPEPHPEYVVGWNLAIDYAIAVIKEGENK